MTDGGDPGALRGGSGDGQVGIGRGPPLIPDQQIPAPPPVAAEHDEMVSLTTVQPADGVVKTVARVGTGHRRKRIVDSARPAVFLERRQHQFLIRGGHSIFLDDAIAPAELAPVRIPPGALRRDDWARRGRDHDAPRLDDAHGGRVQNEARLVGKPEPRGGTECPELPVGDGPFPSVRNDAVRDQPAHVAPREPRDEQLIQSEGELPRVESDFQRVAVRLDQGAESGTEATLPFGRHRVQRGARGGFHARSPRRNEAWAACGFNLRAV